MDAVTPQMYGAIADGVADDTESIQKAVDSGFDVYIPTTHKESYRITKPIRITNSQCKRIFSESISRRSDKGSIIADFKDMGVDAKTVPLFDVHIQLLRINGIRIVSRAVNNHRAGILVNAMDEKLCDYDIHIENCDIKNFYKVACFTGRGFEIVNSKVASCQYLAELYWKDENDTNKNHPAMYDQRGIMVKNCRLHNIASGFFTVKSGHAYGLHFSGNTVDNGSGYLVKAYEQAYGWNISNNVIQGINGDFNFMEFRKGMLNCVITGNTFVSDMGYWVGSEGTVGSWIKSLGSISGSIINSNVFKNSDGAFMEIKNADNSIFMGNVMQNKTGSSSPAIVINGTFKKNVVVGNSATSDKLLSKALPKGNEVVGNCPSS